MRTIAIAGTHGKTTVAWLVREMLEEAQQLTGKAHIKQWAAGSGSRAWGRARVGVGTCAKLFLMMAGV